MNDNTPANGPHRQADQDSFFGAGDGFGRRPQTPYGTGPGNGPYPGGWPTGGGPGQYGVGGDPYRTTAADQQPGGFPPPTEPPTGSPAGPPVAGRRRSRPPDRDRNRSGAAGQG